MENLNITDKKDLIAVLAGEILDAQYWGRWHDLYIQGPSCTTYTEEGQDRFNALHDIIETTINSYLVDQDLKET